LVGGLVKGMRGGADFGISVMAENKWWVEKLKTMRQKNWSGFQAASRNPQSTLHRERRRIANNHRHECRRITRRKGAAPTRNVLHGGERTQREKVNASAGRDPRGPHASQTEFERRMSARKNMWYMQNGSSSHRVVDFVFQETRKRYGEDSKKHGLNFLGPQLVQRRGKR